MSDHVRMAFERRMVVLPLKSIVPCRKVSDDYKTNAKFNGIAKSVAEVGIVEPLVVSRLKDGDDQFLLLDGHVRLTALRDLGATEALCLIASDDEGFTYNKRVNRLSTVQAHFMLRRALESGVSEEKLAKALDIDIQQVKIRKTLLDGICPEVVELFGDKNVSPITFSALRKMKSDRQIEAAELMISVNNWTASYAQALLAGTKQRDLSETNRQRKPAGVSPQQMARMEREMSSLHQDFKRLESSYGDDVLLLVIASGYVAKLVSNAEVARYLGQHHPEILEEFRAIVAATAPANAGGLAA